jgi:hypothetical protein
MESTRDSFLASSSEQSSRALYLLIVFCTLLAVGLCGCGGGGTQSPPPPPPPPVISSVTVSPTSASILIKATQQFTASVQGTGSFNSSIAWYVNDVSGGKLDSWNDQRERALYRSE